jgi:zinc D-Ala-D-Ala dipeptidase
MSMQSELPPGIDTQAPLTRLAPGQHPGGLWVAPEYARRGYASALPEVWLRIPVLGQLLRAVDSARSTGGYGLLIWDGWRPMALQEELYAEYRQQLASRASATGEDLDELTALFVADPSAADLPAHSTGGAVDLTLCDPENGEAVEMGGDFDELTDRTRPDYYEDAAGDPAASEFAARRRILNAVMSRNEFVRFPSEWWHFEYGTVRWSRQAGRPPLFGQAPPPG